MFRSDKINAHFTNEQGEINRDNCTCQPRFLDELPLDAIPYDQLEVPFSGPPVSDIFDDVSLGVILNPMTGILGLESRSRNEVMVNLRKNGDVVTLQWEPFSGQIGSTGIRYIRIDSTLSCNLPISSIQVPIMLEYNGISRIGYLSVNPNCSEIFTFHFDAMNSIRSNLGDNIHVPGGTATWITKSRVRRFRN